MDDFPLLRLYIESNIYKQKARKYVAVHCMQCSVQKENECKQYANKNIKVVTKERTTPQISYSPEHQGKESANGCYLSNNIPRMSLRLRRPRRRHQTATRLTHLLIPTAVEQICRHSVFALVRSLSVCWAKLLSWHRCSGIEDLVYAVIAGAV